MLILDKQRLKESAEILVNLVYIPCCLGCDTVLELDEYERGFCRECAKQIRFIGQHCCIICGKQLKNERTDPLCGDCSHKRHAFTQSKALFLYKGIIKKTMYRLKYSNRRDYAKILGRMAVHIYGDWMKEKQIECVIPVPMYDKKRRARGYNQAEVLAKVIAKEADLPILADSVARIRNTKPQKGLGELERKNNLQNAFFLRKNDVELKKILLIDDIYTTGSTLDEVSKVLLDAGATAVYGLCICAGTDYGGKEHGGT